MRLIALILLFALSSQARQFHTYETGIGGIVTDIRVGFHRERSSDRATLLFFHGYSDQMLNHKPLFSQLGDAGIRVVSFDYPEHGGSTGGIWAWSLEDIADLTSRVLSYAMANPNKPLILAGWSTGATISARILQDWQHVLPNWYKYKVGGAILLAPGLPVYDEIGGGSYLVRESELTRGRLSYRPSPQSVYNHFGLDLLNQSRQAGRMLLRSSRVPVVAISAGRDRFVDSAAIKSWVRRNRNAGKPIFGVHCPEALHGLEFEPGIGREVRDRITETALAMSGRTNQQRIDGVRSRQQDFYMEEFCRSY